MPVPVIDPQKRSCAYKKVSPVDGITEQGLVPDPDVMHTLFARAAPALAQLNTSHGLRRKTRVWKSGRIVAKTRTRSIFWVYMTCRDLVMAALSCW